MLSYFLPTVKVGNKEIKKEPAIRSVPQGIAEHSNEIFSVGKCEIYLTIGEILLRKVKFASRVDGLQSDALKQKTRIQKPEFIRIRVFPYHFRRKYFTAEGNFTLLMQAFTDLEAKSISPGVIHISMDNTLSRLFLYLYVVTLPCSS